MFIDPLLDLPHSTQSVLVFLMDGDDAPGDGEVFQFLQIILWNKANWIPMKKGKNAIKI